MQPVYDPTSPHYWGDALEGSFLMKNTKKAYPDYNHLLNPFYNPQTFGLTLLGTLTRSKSVQFSLFSNQTITDTLAVWMHEKSGKVFMLIDNDFRDVDGDGYTQKITFDSVQSLTALRVVTVDELQEYCWDYITEVYKKGGYNEEVRNTYSDQLELWVSTIKENHIKSEFGIDSDLFNSLLEGNNV